LNNIENFFEMTSWSRIFAMLWVWMIKKVDGRSTNTKHLFPSRFNELEITTTTTPGMTNQNFLTTCQVL